MDKINLKLTVLLFISSVIFVSLMPVKADIVFQDSFGNGNFNNWTVSGSPSIVTAPVVAGSKYSVQFPSNSTNSNTLSYIQASFSQSNMATLEFYFQTDTIPQNSSIDLAQIINNGDNPSESGSLLLTLFTLNNGSFAWAFTYPSLEASSPLRQSAAESLQTKFILSSTQTGVWYKFDIAIAVSGTTGAVELSINDSPVFSVTNVQFIWNPTVFRLGPLTSVSYSSGSVYFDDVTVTNTANIPQSTSTPSPTISPTEPTSVSSAITNSSPSPSNTSTSSLNVPEFSSIAILTVIMAMSLFGTVLIRVKKRKIIKS